MSDTGVYTHLLLCVNVLYSPRENPRSYYPQFIAKETKVNLQFQITSAGVGLAGELVKGRFSKNSYLCFFFF